MDTHLFDPNGFGPPQTYSCSKLWARYEDLKMPCSARLKTMQHHVQVLKYYVDKLEGEPELKEKVEEMNRRLYDRTLNR